MRLRKAKSLAFSGPCLLEILRDFERNLFHIAMFTEEELPRLVVKWQIDHIRQYGSNNMAFKFESGRYTCTYNILCLVPLSSSKKHLKQGHCIYTLYYFHGCSYSSKCCMNGCGFVFVDSTTLHSGPSVIWTPVSTPPFLAIRILIKWKVQITAKST